MAEQSGLSSAACGESVGNVAEVPRLSLVLPAWHEAEAIGRAIREADAALQALSNDYEIIVVDDGSRDGTAERVHAAAATNDAVRLVQHEQNRGYGAALRSGFSAAQKELVIFTDADNQFCLDELDRFVLLAESYDIVCGYRIDRQDPPLRCFYSRVYNQIVRSLLGTGIRDVDCALKLFHRDVIQQLEISTDGFLVNAELLTQARQRDHSIVEVGVSHRPRTEGVSTVSAAHIPSVLASLVRYWWNAVQFPASEKTAAAGLAGDPQTSREPWLGWAQIGLMLIAAVFVLSNLGYPLIDQDETRYAEIPREMLATGNWVLPQLNFEPYYDKPPLLYWLCAISYRLFGISEWSARIVPGLAALATLAATMMFGSRHFGKKAGLISGTVLMLSAGFVFSSRYLLIDGVFSLLVSLSLFASYEAIRGPRFKPQWWMVAAISCGLACLAKGPVALVLFVFPVAAHTSLTKTCVPFRLRHYLWAFGIVGAVSVPWLIAVSRLDSGFLLEFIYTHNVRRFAGDFHARPFWFFVPVLLVAGHPWSFLAVPYARFMLSGDAQMRACRSPSLGFLLLWSGWCFLFFSLSKCKLPTYLLPAAPALALLVGQYFDRILTTLTDHTSVGFARLWSARAATVTTSLVGIGFIAYAFFAGITVSFAVFLWGLLWVTILCGSLLTIGDRRHHRFAWGISAVLTFLLAVMVMHQVLPAYGRAKTIFGPGSPLIGRMEEADELPIATIAHEFSEVPFYLKRSDVVHLPSSDTERLIEWAGNTRDGLVVLDTDVALNRLRAGLPQGTMIRRLGKRGRAYLLHLHLPDRPLRFSQNPRKLSKH